MKVVAVSGDDQTKKTSLPNDQTTDIPVKNKRKSITMLSNMDREFTTLKVTLVGVLCSIVPIMLSAACLGPEIFFDGVKFNHVARKWLAVFIYRLLYEINICTLRSSYHKEKFSVYIYERRVQAAVEFVLYIGFALYLQLADSEGQAMALILAGVLIQTVATAFDFIYEDSEACFESPIVHVIVVPLTRSIMTFFFFSGEGLNLGEGTTTTTATEASKLTNSNLHPRRPPRSLSCLPLRLDPRRCPFPNPNSFGCLLDHHERSNPK